MPKTITELYADLEHAVAAANGLQEGPAFDRAIGKCSDIAWRIVKAPATNKDEMLNKIAAAGWCMGAGADRLRPDWQPGGLANNEAAYALATLRDDLQRLAA